MHCAIPEQLNTELARQNPKFNSLNIQVYFILLSEYFRNINVADKRDLSSRECFFQ